MHKILVVDESKECGLVETLLRELSGLEVRSCGDRARLLEELSGWLPDVIVLDWSHPDRGGLKFIRRIRKQFPDISVILMTSHGDELTVIEALEHGAASYVPKSQVGERLVVTVRQVLERLRVHRSRRRLMNCVTDLDVTYSLDVDLALIPPLVNSVQQQMAGLELCDVPGQVRVAIALEEILRNAMIYGSLELSLPEVAAANQRGDLDSLIKERRCQPPYDRRRVTVRIVVSAKAARFVVRDEGPGFDHSFLAGLSPTQRLHEGHGRGLTLARAFMDEVTFNAPGNEVTLVKLPDRVHRDIMRAISRRQTAGRDHGALLAGLLEKVAHDGLSDVPRHETLLARH